MFTHQPPGGGDVIAHAHAITGVLTPLSFFYHQEKGPLMGNLENENIACSLLFSRPASSTRNDHVTSSYLIYFLSEMYLINTYINM